ncbi:MAG TPA: hypothetical protein VFI20_04240 [Terracidiphilus sp.]|nr:hypothetical protein [Terracidiphilus sp.]
MPLPQLDLRFPRAWQAQVLTARPLILPPRHFTYPGQAQEVERGALEIFVRPDTTEAEPFLATCALGFRDAAVPTGLWSTPHPDVLCAVAGGYAYLIDASDPEQFTMIEYRPVLQVLPVLESKLLLFVGHNAILAWAQRGEAWRTGKLSDEGLSITGIEGDVLRGAGWRMMADKETPFSLNLRNGQLMQ